MGWHSAHRLLEQVGDEERASLDVHYADGRPATVYYDCIDPTDFEDGEELPPRRRPVRGPADGVRRRDRWRIIANECPGSRQLITGADVRVNPVTTQYPRVLCCVCRSKLWGMRQARGWVKERHAMPLVSEGTNAAPSKNGTG